ncbi:MAG: DNA glycosylase AlkZ-like family protein [Propionibacteriaceae bacterium]
MDTEHQLTGAEARRIAVRAQWLTSPRPDDLGEVVHRLTLLHGEPTKAVARSAEMVLWSRLGSAYRLGDLGDALADGSLVELDGVLRPAEDIALYRAEMAAWPTEDWQRPQQDWLEANDGARRDVLAKLYDEGPLPGKELPDTTVLPWQSSGWNNNRNRRMLLQLLATKGEIAAVGQDGRDRLWDLAERVYPDVPVVPLADALRTRNARRLHALGIARPKSAKTPTEPNDVGQVGEPARIDGVQGTWRVDPSHLEGDFSGRVAVLSPLDLLIFDRKRMADLFDFDYQLEMYKPVAKRRWGYWAMPILSGDRLIGKLDATAERAEGELRINALHEDEPFSRAVRADVDAEIESLAAWLDLEVSPSPTP